MISQRDNYLKTVRFENPDYIPMAFHINSACFNAYPQEFLFDQMEAHKLLFPHFVRPKSNAPYITDFGNVGTKGVPYTDDFGCVWETTENGITGTVVKHPLEDMSNFKNYKMPNPATHMGIGEINWDNVAKNIANVKQKGDLTVGGLRHGHTFLQLCDIRGYQNLLFDMFDEEADMIKLIADLEDFNMYSIKKYLSFGVDVMSYPEDLGMQKGPMISPDMFKKYIKPSYQRLMKPARDNGVIVHMHSDGDLHDLVDDLIDGGVQIINLQDLVNGIDWIKDRFAGKTCVELDIDRQDITVFGTPAQVDALIKEEVQKIGTKQGGLLMIYGLYPGTPMENIVALMDAMERYMHYYN